MRILRLGVELVLCSLLEVEGRELPKSDGLRFTEGGEGWEEEEGGDEEDRGSKISLSALRFKFE